MPGSRLCLAALSLLAATALGLASPGLAQSASPALTARVGGVDTPETTGQKLRIETLDVAVRIHGTVAETTITARFANPGQQILEGDFTLLMPPGSVVTGYALDVNGRMIDGVLVDQRQARLAYEARVRQRIDPGLAEVGRDNVFHTRVFPIFPRSGRTIRLQFTTPLDPRTGYVLPFRDTAAIGNFILNVEARGLEGPPALEVPGRGAVRWTSEGGVHRFRLDQREASLSGDLMIAAPESAVALLTSRSAGGETFFQIADSVGPRSRGEAPPVESVLLLWDRSLSRADDELEREIALVRQYLDRVRPGAIEIVLFDASGVERRRARGTAEAVRILRAVRYRGATSFSVLAREDLGDADACLMFSDGLATIDATESFQPVCPLFALSSGSDANRAWLRALAGRTGGEAFDLSVREAGEVLTRMTRRVPRVVSVRSTGGAPVDYSLLDGGEFGWRIVGPMPATGGLVVRLAGIGRGIEERIYAAPPVAAVETNGAAALWASERVAVLAARDDLAPAELVAFSRRFSVASPEVSFVVLETGRDYAQAGIDPPGTLPEEMRQDYSRVRNEMKEAETRQRATRLASVVSQWEEMRRWWAARHSTTGPRVRRDADSVGSGRGRRPAPVPQSAPPPPVVAPAPTSPGEQFVVSEQADSSIVTTGSRAGRGQSGALAGRQGSRGTIEIEPWAADRPYLAALDEAPAAEWERVFAEQQARHGSLPAFWLDVADWAWRKGRREDAVRLLLSALELPTRNSQTLSIVAERLLRYGEVDRAIALYERLLAAESDRPQPRRSLALALARRAQTAPRGQARADLARALALLTEVVVTPWSEAYRGIEMISLMEANRLIPRFRALGGGDLALDPRLIALLDVDIRVVIEWFTEATDVDLWIDEPTGERAIYHNPRTAIGGRLSDDMTQGFGPEEYLLRRAVPGAYEVRANIFSSDRLNPNGAQRVTARIIRDFGRPTEREEIVDLEILANDPNRERRVGRIVFEGPMPHR